MFLKRTVLVCLGALVSLEAATPQTPPTQPPPPAAPSAPRPLSGGRSVRLRSMAPKRGWLGVGLGDLTSERMKALKLRDDSGVEVTHVDGKSPAAKAGLGEHDVILEVNGQKVEDGLEFAGTIAEMAPGSKVILGIWRGGAKRTITATLEARPLQVFYLNNQNGDLIPPMPPMPVMPEGFSIMTGQSPRVGFEGETLTPQLAEFFGVKEGILVRTVSEKTAASKAGLKAGDVIIKVSGTPVSSTREIAGIIRALHRNVTFTVMRNHKEVLLNVEIAEERLPSPDREVL
jgi:serine protease Do